MGGAHQRKPPADVQQGDRGGRRGREAGGSQVGSPLFCFEMMTAEARNSLAALPGRHP